MQLHLVAGMRVLWSHCGCSELTLWNRPPYWRGKTARRPTEDSIGLLCGSRTDSAQIDCATSHGLFKAPWNQCRGHGALSQWYSYSTWEPV